MADQGPSKQDINTIFKRLRSIPTNKQCFDCSANNPTWASVTYGVFLCIDCSAVHRSLGVHLTFIRSTQLDTSWTWLQLRAMQVGGNAAATAYFRQHGCTSTDAQQKYNSRAATLYREKLHGLAVKALKLHGTKLHLHDHKGQLHIDASDEVHSPVNKDVDFFKQHDDNATKLSNWESSTPSTQGQTIPVSNGSVNKDQQLVDNGEGPSVEAALSTSPTEAIKTAEPRKPTIGGRKPTAAKKGGLGAKKGLGGQKVKTSFSDIESQAIQRDKDREQLAENLAIQEAKTKEEQEKKMASMRLAYQDLSVQEKKHNEKLKHMDPKKAEQAQRLGMGFAGARGVSHSVVSDMKIIEQEKPREERSRYSRDRDFDDFEFISSGGFSTGPPKYNDSPFGTRKEDRWGSDDRYGSNSSSGWGSLKSSGDKYDSKQSTIEDIPMHKPDDDRGRIRKSFDGEDTDEAQKKFGSAKAISSDQFFGNKDPDFEMRQNLSKFDGKSSISSSELFGNGPSQQRSSSQYGSAGPDLQEIKDGVRQGVTKVAGKISSLTNGIISSIQRK